MTAPVPSADPSADRRPASDVSVAVGLCGLIALGGWIALCHFWPEIVGALGLDSRAERLVGPYAALTGLVVAAAPMAVGSAGNESAPPRLDRD